MLPSSFSRTRRRSSANKQSAEMPAWRSRGASTFKIRPLGTARVNGLGVPPLGSESLIFARRAYAERSHEASGRGPSSEFLCNITGVSGLERPFRGLILLAALGFSGASRADTEPEPASAEAVVPAQASLGSRFGVAHLARLLSSTGLADRLRGIRRLSALGTHAALNRLSSFVFERRAALGGREWLTLARGFALHAAYPKSELVLSTLLEQRPADGAGPDEVELFNLARGVAALALAREGSAASLSVLGRALRTFGRSAALAREALLAYPPPALELILDAPGEPTLELVQLLGSLGDQRAFHSLRAWVRSETVQVRAASAVALTQLGAMETVPLARIWLAAESPVLQRAALEILLLAQDPAAARTLGKELSAAGGNADLQERALGFPSRELVKIVISRLDRADPDERWLWTLLGRIGGDTAARRLEVALAEPDSAFAAAHALSRLVGSDGHAALARALEGEVASPLSARAAAARRRIWHERFAGLDERLVALRRSDVASERAAAAWSLSLGGGANALSELESGDEARVLAAANNALWFDDRVLERASRLLASASAGSIRTALSVCLLRPSGQRSVASTVLWSLVSEAGASRPLALRALASRNDPELAGLVEGYLDDPDPLLRAHVARGLGERVEPSGVGLLAERFEFETDENVRQAIVYALSSQSGQAPRRTIQLAAALDPSAPVRGAARLALAGVRLGDPPATSEFLWAEVRSPDPEGASRSGNSAMLLNVAPGLAFPVFGDAAGLLVVAGVSVNHLEIRLQ